MHEEMAPDALAATESQPAHTAEHLQAALTRALEQIQELEKEKRELLQAANHARWLQAL